jgi:hypothetical protein
MNEPRGSRWTLACLVLLMAVAALGSWWVTRVGPGWTNTDSAVYTYAASSFLEHGDFMMPDRRGGLEKLHVWPPMYPLLLAALSKPSGGVIPAARWLNVILFPINILLMAALGRCLRLSAWAGLLACAAFALAPGIWWAHVMAMSESSCLFFWLLGLWLLLGYERRQSWPWLVLAALALAGAVLCRYMAIAPVTVGGLFALAYTRGGWRRQAAAVAAYTLITLAPLLYWMHAQSSATGVGAVGRKLGVYGLAQSQAISAIGAFVRWIVPFDGHSWLKLGYLAILVGLALTWVALVGKNRNRFRLGAGWNWRQEAPVVLLLVNLLAAEGLIFVAAMFVDATEFVGERIHIYSLAMTLLLVASGATAWARSESARTGGAARSCGVAFLVLFMGAYLAAGVLWLARARALHLEFNNTPWRESKGLDLLQQRYADSPVYANYFGPIYLRTGRLDFHYVPEASDAIRHLANPELDSEIAEMAKALADTHGIIIYFKDLDPKMITVEELEKYPSLRVVDETDDAVFLCSSADHG